MGPLYPNPYGNQAIIAQWLAWRLATGEVPGSNPGKKSLISDEFEYCSHI